MGAREVAASAACAMALLAAGCGSANEQGNRPGGGQGSGRTACLVVSGSGVDDHSFNQAAWTGVQAGAKSSGLTPRYAQVANDADYASAADAFTKQSCAVIVTNGFPMADATKDIAGRSPDKKFA